MTTLLPLAPPWRSVSRRCVSTLVVPPLCTAAQSLVVTLVFMAIRTCVCSAPCGWPAVLDIDACYVVSCFWNHCNASNHRLMKKGHRVWMIPTPPWKSDIQKVARVLLALKSTDGFYKWIGQTKLYVVVNYQSILCSCFIRAFMAPIQRDMLQHTLIIRASFRVGFATLNLPVITTKGEVKSRFRKLSRMYHPNRYISARTGKPNTEATVLFQHLNNSNEQLNELFWKITHMLS